MKELIQIQSELKAPKSQRNDFGRYNYRSCEDILEAVKPLLNKYNSFLTLSDEIINVGNRNYVKATATIFGPDDKQITVTANACEAETKKGMDSSQITGAASSYARKYALNGLFAIDDTKDADPLPSLQKPQFTVANNPITAEQAQELTNLARMKKLQVSQVKPIFNKYNITKFDQLPADNYAEVKATLAGM